MQTEWQTVDPDQTSQSSLRSSLISVYTVCPDLPVRKLRVITVFEFCFACLSNILMFASGVSGEECILYDHLETEL